MTDSAQDELVKANRTMSRWYIIHAYSGFENKVKDQILADATRLGQTTLDASVRTCRMNSPGVTLATVLSIRSSR